MDITIEKRRRNPLLDQVGLEGTVDHSGNATPSSDSLKEALSDELGTDKEDIKIVKIFTFDGMQKSRFWAKEIGGTVDAEEKEETAETKDEGAEEDDQDISEVLSGSISDAKERIEEMDDPDFELLLEVEQENKDRKGMKKFLKDKIGE